MATETTRKLRVCVVGAGAAGLCAVRQLSEDLLRFEPAIFEQADKVGGTWVYVEKIGQDDHGVPIHSSMYESLRTNFPMKLMNFPDYQKMDQTRPCCGTHQQVLNYLNDYADHFAIRKFIQVKRRWTADALLYCTGYKYTYPFLHEDCGIRVDENFVTPLWKQLINIHHPTMSFVGLPSRIIPFPLFHFQIGFFLSLLKGRIELPSKEIMLMDTRPSGEKKHGHVLGSRQWEYNNELVTLSGAVALPEFYENGYTSWTTHRTNNFLKCKDSEMIIEADGKTVRFVIDT
ncbi:flavin-containing monooxygenase FMO GS-OX-like 4 [Fopius arisanus]|uniref:Flavin-containing monooxygenase n=1 Tax=Fopius arisanus TaxID=64838 RepID=A0A9R1TAB5_9HYME|nr:PREDICTED: flavin-containing monooxygenase FMO GS-OX-like 4 [Fopius arisanus]